MERKRNNNDQEEAKRVKWSEDFFSIFDMVPAKQIKMKLE